MDLLQKIKEPVQAEMKAYDDFLRESLRSQHGLTQEIIDYVLESRGKSVRPLLVLLCASMLRETDSLPESTLLSAMLVEMTHTASLIHDDVIDDASVRRGKPSVRALWSTPKAILIGDFILSRSFSLGMKGAQFRVVTYLADTVGSLCEGEMLQSESTDKMHMTREIYNEIIMKKTALLIGSSCGAGAISVGAPQEFIDRLIRFGENLGMAFQIKDDILDYSLTAKTGKIPCGDLREKRITLPLLTVLEKSTPERRNELLELLSNAPHDEESVSQLRTIVEKEGGLQKAEEIMEQYLTKARSIIITFPLSRYRDSLELFCDYFAIREN